MTWEEKSSVFENVTAAVGLAIVFISTLCAPRLSANLSREELAKDGARKAQRIAALQTWLKAAQQGNDSLRAQLVSADARLDQGRAELNALTEERDGLKAQVASATSQLQELDTNFKALQQEMAKFREVVSLQQVADERDKALERAKKAEERIRELTLQLNRAGIWP